MPVALISSFQELSIAMFSPDRNAKALVGAKKDQHSRSCLSQQGLGILRHPQEHVEIVLWFLVEGVDISVMVRFTGYSDSTLTRWLLRMGQHSNSLHNHFFFNIKFDTLQLDALYARVRNANKSQIPARTMSRKRTSSAKHYDATSAEIGGKNY